MKRALLLLLAAGLVLLLSGCRVRTGGGREDAVSAAAGGIQSGGPGEGTAGAAGTVPDSGETDRAEGEASGERTRENPDSSRKEYDENAQAEVVPGTDRLLHGEGDGNGAFLEADGENPEAVRRLNDRAEEAAVQEVPAPEAEKKGVSEDAEKADSAMTYYTVLLQERSGSLYECQRASVYWETAEDHVTVHKTSPEHALILKAGAYDVSARLLPENLRVDDGWVARKNPGVIVKVVDSGVLGSRVGSDASAGAVYQRLCLREGWPGIDAVRDRKVVLISCELMDTPSLQTAAALVVAKAANPELYGDVDLRQALRMLAEESAGITPEGIWYYPERED